MPLKKIHKQIKSDFRDTFGKEQVFLAVIWIINYFFWQPRESSTCAACSVVIAIIKLYALMK